MMATGLPLVMSKTRAWLVPSAPDVAVHVRMAASWFGHDKNVGLASVQPLVTTNEATLFGVD